MPLRGAALNLLVQLRPRLVEKSSSLDALAAHYGWADEGGGWWRAPGWTRLSTPSSSPCS